MCACLGTPVFRCLKSTVLLGVPSALGTTTIRAHPNSEGVLVGTLAITPILSSLISCLNTGSCIGKGIDPAFLHTKGLYVGLTFSSMGGEPVSTGIICMRQLFRELASNFSVIQCFTSCLGRWETSFSHRFSRSCR